MIKKQKQPQEINRFEWIQCQEFAFQFARQQGFYRDVKSYREIENSRTFGEQAYQQGLNLAIVSCKFWRAFYRPDE